MPKNVTIVPSNCIVSINQGKTGFGNFDTRIGKKPEKTTKLLFNKLNKCAMIMRL
jgi:hypothetical protein